MNKFKIYLMIPLMCVLLFGCVQSNILDQVGLTTLIGYDVGKENAIAVTSVIREVNPEFQSNVEIFTTENDTIKGNQMKTNRKLSKKTMVGQMRVVLFGEELAKDNLHYFIKTNLENPEVGKDIYMAVVNGESSELLKYEYKNVDDIGQHIFRLIDQNVKQEFMISTTLHEIANYYYSDGIEIAMPIIKRNEEHVELSGIALFKGGKMVSTLPAKDNFFIKIIRDSLKVGLYETILQDDEVSSDLLQYTDGEIKVVLDAIQSKREINLVDKAKPEFDLYIKIKSRLLEDYPNVDKKDDKSITALETAIEKQLKQEISRVIAHTQDVESDIFGFGEKYRSSVRNANLTKEKWQEMYKFTKVNVHVDLTILRSGVFE